MVISKSHTSEFEGPLESLNGRRTHLLREDDGSNGIQGDRVVEVLIQDEPLVGEIAATSLHLGLVHRLQILEATLVGDVVLSSGVCFNVLYFNSQREPSLSNLRVGIRCDVKINFNFLDYFDCHITRSSKQSIKEYYPQLRVSGILVVIVARWTGIPSESDILIGKVLKVKLSFCCEVEFHSRGVSAALADPGLPVYFRLDSLNYLCCVLRCDPLIEEISQLDVCDAGQLVSRDIIPD